MRPSLRQSNLRSSEERGILVGRPELSTLVLRAAGAALWREGSSRPGPIVVAVSGGLDSLLLLHALAASTVARVADGTATGAHDANRLRATGPELICAHVHHGVRGSAADADAAFVREEAQRLGLPYVQLDADPARIWKQGVASEGRMRAERYRLLDELARARGSGSVFVGHHLDDRIESIVLAAAREAGLRGLSGMPRRRGLRAGDPAGPRLVRPWYDLPRATLRDAARERGLTWREDATNAELTASRNRVRHVVMPRLRADFGAAIDARLLRLARLARVLVRRARRDGHRTDGDAVHARCEALAGIPIRKHASLRIQELVNAGTSGAVDVGPGSRIVVRDGRVEARRPPPALVPAQLDVRTFRARVAAAVAACPPARLAERLRDRGFLYVDADVVAVAPRFRTRVAGDRIDWPGLPHPVRLKTLLASHHVPRELRDHLVVVDVGGRVGAVEGLGTAAWSRVTTATRSVLRIRIRRSDDAPQARTQDAALPSGSWEPPHSSSGSSPSS